MSPYKDPIIGANLAREALAAEVEEPHYTRSNGVRVPLREMATPHLRFAAGKLAREFPDHHELPAMEAVIAKRDAEYAARQAEESQL